MTTEDAGLPDQFWIATYTGRAVDLLNPDPETLVIEDIIRHLSQIPRWTGATRYPYTVAQHSCLVARIAQVIQAHEPRLISMRDLTRGALLHDAAEAYLGDVSTPLKRAMRKLSQGPSTYDVLYRRMEDAIVRKFLAGFMHDPIVRRADALALVVERDALMPKVVPSPWGADLGADVYYVPWAAPLLAQRDHDAFRDLWRSCAPLS